MAPIKASKASASEDGRFRPPLASSPRLTIKWFAQVHPLGFSGPTELRLSQFGPVALVSGPFPIIWKAAHIIPESGTRLNTGVPQEFQALVVRFGCG